MTTVYYFGPLKESGHFLFRENGQQVGSYERPETGIPWKDEEIDGTLQPGMVLWRDHWVQRGSSAEGLAALHHKDGWTALSMWDSSVDERPGCSSTYIAEGIFTFEQMVELAKVRFKDRWDKMQFEVRLYTAKDTP